ncbi:ABC-type nitrate/sulfonate/bicarbonate transport system, ATPase component [Schinkia azotoformans MEV2011]|uniref:ABC-type nitrate/sulfonate/bicarbonate transport system, ATPase component n=1 Tax=Schinkia azotoformans MEV2011 TaxID=1348973 RepID=A0A072NRD2_SCHAZ|nr:ABC transporter ATP-binding protein [Schinkia azotoformans]KEF40026.1 ABC-type nitrate/sulfonate/bicarbonate transport system, ATPase component [Schinkia azotoformans MEV2011]MEC1694722.1 ABC transporter ATP-binding protein [Schinkia azotoformans]MEC1726405.1 ABC transporter ATP-binding protein [Schinkia azotoformans]MEC1756955.1 ABC transporter ATP-binding protein [Schinkia azotoformans]MEC1771021.1 ABC transporter ATP-binding protein [Schinkia azotoformans]
MSTILFEDINVKYDKTEQYALKNLNLTIQAGQIVSLIGPSGCGKSTTLNLAAGLLTPTSGAVKINDSEITGPGLDRGVVFQNYSLFPWMTVLENITFALKQKSTEPKEVITKKAIQILAKVGLDEKAQKSFPSALSGGMQQRVAIARMFILDAPVFLMDEPFSAVDEITRNQLQDLLLNLWEEGETKKTVLVVTHNIDEAIFLSDRVVVLHDGQIQEDLAIPFKRPRNRFNIDQEEEYTKIRRELLKAISGEY